MISEVRKKEWLALLLWMGVLLFLLMIDDHYPLFTNARVFIVPFCWVGSWTTKYYLKRNH
ncbi:MAG: hypothetical protein ABS916_02710 [Carnobacterium sp.]|uniref:hypothetical protein n=1 Tax=Carnobacterium sp. TaxID=48221 RepID=UPI0033146472